jgi:hypothetical protein
LFRKCGLDTPLSFVINQQCDQASLRGWSGVRWVCAVEVGCLETIYHTVCILSYRQGWLRVLLGLEESGRGWGVGCCSWCLRLLLAPEFSSGVPTLLPPPTPPPLPSFFFTFTDLLGCRKPFLSCLKVLKAHNMH